MSDLADAYAITEEEYRRMEACILEAVPTAELRYHGRRLQWRAGSDGDSVRMRRVARKAAELSGTPVMCDACLREMEVEPIVPRTCRCIDVRRPPFSEDCGVRGEA